MDIKSALKTAMPQETRLLDRGPDSLYARVIEFAEHLEELGALWLRIERSWMVIGRYRKNRTTGQPHQWYENFFMQGEDPNQVRKALNRFLETNRLDALSPIYDDQAQPPVNRVTPVLARLQHEIYKKLEYDGSYNSVEAVGGYINLRLPRRFQSKPMELRCAALFLKRYDESTGAEKRKVVIRKVVGRLSSTDTISANILRKSYTALGGNAGELEFWDEHLAKYHAEQKKNREAWAREQED
jgi:hypothetical protein